MRPFVVLNLVALAFWALCASYRVALSFIGVVESKALPSVIAGIAGSPVLLSQTVAFIFAVLLLHVALASAWYVAWVPVQRYLWPRDDRASQRAVAGFLPVLLAVIAINLHVYPESVFAAELGAVSSAVVVLMTIALVGYVVAVPVAALSIWITGLSRRRRRALAAATAGIAVLTIIWVHALPGTPVPERRSAPDVILVGFDSLRTDIVTDSPELIPGITAFLQESVVVQDAWTPMGRTFPAMVSLFTGRFPVSHGARFNLIARDSVDDRPSIVRALHDADYQTLFAIDETRFSNIDEDFGFDHVISPSIGAFDFLAGAMDDLPLLNLVMNTGAGRLLFPHIHFNRAMPVTYRPETFDRHLGRAVARLQPERPALIVVHYELPHWPYRWADVRSATPVPDPAERTPQIYRAAVVATDGQFGRLVNSLTAAGRLENAIVVLFTDHGEAFWTSEPRLTRQPHGPGVVTVYAGHGTHVFSANQNRTLLAFRAFGPEAGRFQARVVSGITASLADVAPTLAEFLGVPLSQVDGRSLVGVLGGTERHEGFRAVPLETGFTPPSVAAGSPDTAELVASGLAYYDIGSDGRLSLSASLLPELLSDKQRAVVSGHWVLGAIPGVGGVDFLLADLDRLLIWNADAPLPADAPITGLWDELCRWFAADSVAIGHQCLARTSRGATEGEE